ncbi:MAG: 5'-nucleotidase [Chromatiaceae bacterium]|nr:MAG: 5'-nucleotidase [Chromatiaceae bacterium]
MHDVTPAPPGPPQPIRLVVGISSRALFDLSAAHQVFEEHGVEAYHDWQVAREGEVLAPGVAFTLTRKLLALNEQLGERGRVDVILLSRNSSDTGLRVFNSIRHYELPISRAVFTGGASPYRYVGAFGAHLFLSADPSDVQQALAAGCAAATILPGPVPTAPVPTQALTPTEDLASAELRIAFDGDAVLFSDAAERIYRTQGLDAFTASEVAAAMEPLPAGPFKGFLIALQGIQALFPANATPLRTALITARGAPAHERVVRTLRAWGIRIDESLFLSGLRKGPFLAAFDADIYFDDQEGHCLDAGTHVTTGHVPHGIANGTD